MERIFLPESSAAAVLCGEGDAALFTEIHRVEQIQQSTVVQICVSNKSRLFAGIKIRDDSVEEMEHFAAVAGVAGVYKEIFVAMAEDGGVAAAGRLDQREGYLTDGVFRDPGKKCFASAAIKKS